MYLRLKAKTSDLFLVNMDRIEYIQAKGEYCELRWASDDCGLTVRHSLQEIEEMLMVRGLCIAGEVPEVRSDARAGSEGATVSEARRKVTAYLEWVTQYEVEHPAASSMPLSDVFAGGWDTAEKRQAEIVKDLVAACEAARDWFASDVYGGAIAPGMLATLNSAIKTARGQS